MNVHEWEKGEKLFPKNHRKVLWLCLVSNEQKGGVDSASSALSNFPTSQYATRTRSSVENRNSFMKTGVERFLRTIFFLLFDGEFTIDRHAADIFDDFSFQPCASKSLPPHSSMLYKYLMPQFSAT